MTATLNGKDVLSCTLNEPRIGRWNAIVDVDSDEAISGKVTLTIDGVSWVGAITKGDLHAGRFHAQIVGGAGKISKQLDVKHYRGGTLGSVVSDIMRETGETLSATTDPQVRSHAVSRWTRPLDKASIALQNVANELGLVWRVLRDGTVWLGTDTWTEAKTEHDELDRSPGRDTMLIAPAAPHLQPGQTFSGKRISRVVTSIQEGFGLRQELQFESAEGGSRISEDIAAIIDQRTSSKIDYSRLYPSRVVRQSQDGSLEILPDAQNLRGNGLTGVPIRHGIPGIKVQVPTGGKVMLFFEAGDPKLPGCALWPDGSSCLSAELTFATELKITAPTVTLSAATVNVDGNLRCAGEVTARATSVPTNLGLHTHPTPVGVSGPPTPGT